MTTLFDFDDAPEWGEEYPENYGRHAHTTDCWYCQTFENPRPAALKIVLSKADDEWKDRARRFIINLPVGAQFTADDLFAACDLPESSSNAVGALIAGMAKTSLIMPIGYLKSTRKSNHGRVLRLWQRTH
jgi:hypothetical protein